MDLTQSLEERLNLINCSPADIRRFIAAHPPASRVVPVSGAVRGKHVVIGVGTGLKQGCKEGWAGAGIAFA